MPSSKPSSGGGKKKKGGKSTDLISEQVDFPPAIHPIVPPAAAPAQPESISEVTPAAFPTDVSVVAPVETSKDVTLPSDSTNNLSSVVPASIETPVQEVKDEKEDDDEEADPASVSETIYLDCKHMLRFCNEM